MLIIVKEGALFIIASGAFGLNFVFIAYQLLILSKTNKDNKLKRFRYLFEAIVALGDGIYIILVPEMADMWYMLITGVFLIMDSIFESIGLVRLLVERKIR